MLIFRSSIIDLFNVRVVVKILVVTQYFNPENFRINDLVQGLVDEGHSVEILTGLPNYPQGSLFAGYSFFTGPFREVYADSNIYRVPIIPRGKNKGILLLLNYVSFALAASFFSLFYFRSKKYDQIFVYEVSPITVALPAIFIKYLKKIKITMWVTDLWPESLSATGVVKNKTILKLVEFLVRFIYKHTDTILMSSQAFTESIMRYTHKNPIYLPQWAEDCFLEKKIQKSVDSELPKGFKVLFAGNIGTSQSFETIIESARELKKYSDIHWLILGEGLGKEAAVKLVKELALENNFHFLGARALSEMPAYYSAVDGLIISLKSTPLFEITVPAKVQACLASGKPILASINGEAARILNEANGLVSPAGDAQKLANNVLKLYKMTSEERENCGHNGREYYLKNFERSKLIKKIVSSMSLN